MAEVRYVKVTRKVETNCITSTKDLVLCNKRIISHTAKMHKTTEVQVSEILNFIGGYTRGVIARGIMETVMLPYFGKFKPKVKEIQAAAIGKQYAKLGKHAIMKAIRIEKLKQDALTGSRRKS